MDQWARDIPVTQLSNVFQDAMRVTLELGLFYLWIDSLCIVQDSDGLKDWKDEAPRMGDVYSQATYAIAASGFENGKAALFHRLGVRAPEFSLDCVPVNWGLEKVFPHADSLAQFHCRLFAFQPSYDTRWPHDLVFEPWSFEDGPLYKRGWAAQERVLSPRIIHFSGNQTYWECGKGVANETFPALRKSFYHRDLSLRRLFDKTIPSFYMYDIGHKMWTGVQLSEYDLKAYYVGNIQEDDRQDKVSGFTNAGDGASERSPSPSSLTRVGLNLRLIIAMKSTFPWTQATVSDQLDQWIIRLTGNIF